MTSKTQTQQFSKDELAITLRELNKLGVGYLKLAECFKMSKKSIYDLIGNSVLEVDKTNTKRKAYNQHLFSEIEYFIDIARIKRNSLLSHNYDTLKNFPLLVAIADKLGNIVYYDLIDFTSENGFSYFKTILSAKLDKSKVIHCDIYSLKLFAELEKLGFKVCYVSKKIRIELLKASGNNNAMPFYQQIEHNFANIQKYLRRLIKTVDLKQLDTQTAKSLLDATIKLYWFNNAMPLITLFQSLRLMTIHNKPLEQIALANSPLLTITKQ